MPEYIRPTTWISYTPNEKVKVGSPAVLTQFSPVPKDYKGEINTEWTLLEELLAIPFYATLTASPASPLRAVNYIDLDIRSAFHIPLPSTLKFAQFTNSNSTAKWDSTDEGKVKNVPSATAIASGLKGKIVLIGDTSNTFEYFGVRSPGPFIFRNPFRAIQIVLLNGIFKVTDMLLQLLDPSQSSSTETIVYTQSAIIAPKEKDIIIIDGPGNINLPQSPPNGFRFTIDDRKFKRLSPGRNAVVPATGERIGLGQSSSIVDHYQPVEWISEDAGSFSWWIYEASTRNWAVLLTRDNGGILTQGSERPLLLTGNSPFTASPYDRLYLNGNGDILIYQLIQERQFIEISWQAGANWIVKVVCPIGFTFNGAYEDLEINTALTSVTRLQIVLKPGNDFGIGA